MVITVDGCATDPTLTSAAVNANPIVTAIASSTNLYQAETVQLIATGGLTYSWTPALDLNNSFSINPIASPPVGTTTYTVTATDVNGCTGTASVTVEVDPQTQIEVVDLFTPNGDGVNDTWTINFLDNVGNYALKIYSRDGTEIYETNNYTNDWDGTYKGNDLPEGTYWYIIKADNGLFRGAVTLKR